MRRELPLLAAAAVLSACGQAAHTPAATPISIAAASLTPSPAATAGAAQRSGVQDTVPGPAGLTLSQEIGAVMMVGFTGPLTPSVLADWRRHQYGGLILLSANKNAGPPSEVRQVIQGLRAAAGHTLLVATDRASGSGLAGSPGPAVVEAGMKTTASGLKALGFDVILGPVANVWDGVDPATRDRSYGQEPSVVAQDVTAAVAGIHAAGMYSVARDFPGAPPDLVPFQAAARAQVDFVMVGDPRPGTFAALRDAAGFHGLVISEDVQAGAAGQERQPPAAAVRFLAAGADMVIVGHDLSTADATYDAIHAAVLDGSYPRGQLDASVQKLLSLNLKFMP